ncbi:MAG: DUF2933 domain-containing protein [Anaerolineae bacterium]
MNMQNGLDSVGKWARSRTGIVTIALLAIAGFFLIAEHYAHLYEILPYALLFLCPLLMLFMHGGHGSRDQGDNSPKNDKPHVHGGES